ncbi:MAG: hypothetical protein GTO41_23470 [Burkholderiales bacterium]|nr:hypothetical protein [Burkholderiales bacterium]
MAGWDRGFIRPLVVLGGLACSGLIVGSAVWAQGVGVDRAEVAMEGNWRLEEEWQAGGELLAPPRADGRMSLHNGAIMVLRHRDAQGVRKSFYGYGTYELTRETWTYGCDRYVVFTDTGSVVTTGGGPFEGRRAYQMRVEGEKLILDNDNGLWMLIFAGGTLTYLDKGIPLRRWRRMPSQ